MPLKQRCSGIWIVPLIVVLDRVSKALAMNLLSGSQPAVPGLINMNYVRNTGMAFSMLSGNALWLAAVTALALAALMLWLIVRPKSQTKLMRVGLWLLIAGGLGNLYDRVVYGYVVDFIELTFMHFAIFNIADIAVTVGVAITALGLLLPDKRKERPNA